MRMQWTQFTQFAPQARYAALCIAIGHDSRNSHFRRGVRSSLHHRDSCRRYLLLATLQSAHLYFVALFWKRVGDASMHALCLSGQVHMQLCARHKTMVHITSRITHHASHGAPCTTQNDGTHAAPCTTTQNLLSLSSMEEPLVS
jgi:hypothetical protein